MDRIEFKNVGSILAIDSELEAALKALPSDCLYFSGETKMGVLGIAAQRHTKNGHTFNVIFKSTTFYSEKDNVLRLKFPRGATYNFEKSNKRQTIFDYKGHTYAVIHPFIPPSSYCGGAPIGFNDAEQNNEIVRAFERGEIFEEMKRNKERAKKRK